MMVKPFIIWCLLLFKVQGPMGSPSSSVTVVIIPTIYQIQKLIKNPMITYRGFQRAISITETKP